MMHEVFISYSSYNKNVADAVCNRLESGGIRCWYAPRDIQVGSSWAGAIMRAIENSRVFLLIYSQNYNKSQQVLNELTAAVDEGCIIVPFRVDQTEMNDDLAFYLKKVHWLDAINPPTKKEIDMLYSHVCAILGRETQQEQFSETLEEERKPGSQRQTPQPVVCQKTKAVKWILVVILLLVLGLYLGRLQLRLKAERSEARKEAYEQGYSDAFWNAKAESLGAILEEAGRVEETRAVEIEDIGELLEDGLTKQELDEISKKYEEAANEDRFAGIG